ncbi:p-hydroxybenzoate 3-monooxygenase [Streptoalloteichus tenebrarius]|uniref:p-hydroxybenzoate 3-monooxygenase n=1 Tax=Streptoalloteichus tenebrarius (strain ATCC 17920 / DSM 40477 / JCM 4838 / CBS 697.72 / NBRC 16177 / NCIMB 11028 / NRRL B-12390 / A12253. 1 / ISP 5477) TaxID=1933 RepID=A0ABT1HVJ9_STRSD|nr:4-hydroxybenzoate 3-monooxygenase [Streptoalloteichus tenebrarius]MCP2259492.1 p-hydroxybenzoate 3-monooxygenase [Streptoalloteichus tenebrarius]BFF01428.1 4-hydroxybenzoate 3-monooxygenase [Streptoalloteichus tenebrarius]
MAVIGAGPAGLIVANLLRKAGVDCVVLERHTRAHVEQRARAGLIEPRVVEMLRRFGLADRLLRMADAHTTCEFRIDGRRHEINYSAAHGGRRHYVYPQQELVTDLVAAFLDAGGDLRFQAADVRPHGLDTDRPWVTYVDGATGETTRLDCDFVAGCDGFHGVSRASVPAGALTEHSHEHGIGWLSVLAEAPPSTKAIIYALHPDGFAGHMLRSSTVSRFYLQCPVGDSVDNWPDERVWAELHKRLALRDEDWTLTEGPIIEKRVLDMRSFVVEPMSYGRLYLAGDAAHIITPVGGKGMNLAAHDAERLAEALVAHYEGSDALLHDYSATCLRRVWRSQEFCQWMTEVIHASRDAGSSFRQRLAVARLEHLLTSPAAAAVFAENYLGQD